MKQSPALILLCFSAMMVMGMGCAGNIKYPDGGYDYPKKIEDSNYYFYPFRDSFPKKDSPAKATDFLYCFFDEPNLSIGPKNEDIFRFFLLGFKQTPVIIVLKKNSLIVKKARTGEFFVKDTDRLTPLERLHYRILFNPLHRNVYFELLSSKKSVDSLSKLYPKLFDKEYRKYLSDKAAKVPNKLFKYTTVQKAIPYREFYRIVSLINKSGYWKLPMHLTSKEESSDGFEYILEANTAKKYNCVFADDFNDEEDFKKACQELVACAGLDVRTVGWNKGIQLCYDSTLKRPSRQIYEQELNLKNEDQDKSATK